MHPHLERRVETLQTLMQESGLDAVIFADRENCIYYLDTIEVECIALVVPAKGPAIPCCLWLDAPYVEERSGCDNVIPYRFPHAHIGHSIVQALQSCGVKNPCRMGFHKYFVELNVFSALQNAFPDMEYLPAAELTYRVRSVKDSGELDRIKKACSYVDIGMEAAVKAVAPGVTEVDVLAEADYAMRKAGSQGSSFRMQVLTPGKQLLAHPFADTTPIGDDQCVVVHLGASHQGYVSKMCRTVAVGTPQRETLDILDLLIKAQDVAARALVPGVPSADVFDKVYALVQEAGYGDMFFEYLGYGIGTRQSEFFPIVGKGLDHVLQKDMVVDLLLPTIYKRGIGGPRITDAIHVTETGGEFLTSFPRECIRN